MAGGGKRLRPVLCLLTCEALGGDAEKALPFALAVEILHNMLLLHDDVEDGDRMRRDRPTVWVKYGVPNAVNAGDYLLARAYSIILSSPLPARTITRLLALFSDTAEQTIRGQGLDIALRAAPDFTVRRYLRLVEWKTGRYLVLGMVGGAIIAGAPEPVVNSICTLGRTLGPAFQIRDDIIDLTVGKGRGGEIGCDIKEGKASIMYARALEVSKPDERRSLIRIMAKLREETTAGDVRWVMGLYRRRGCVQFAQQYADRLVRKASRVIEAMPAAGRERLKEIATYLVRRSG
jgi:geranylgeranyl pyrophosphate synthase